MDRLVSDAWLEKELKAPDLRILDCTVSFATLPDGRPGRYQSGRPAWEEGHIPGSAHIDLLQDLSDQSSQFPFMLPSAHQFSAVMGNLGVGDGTRVVLYDSFMNVWAARLWWMLRAFGFDEAGVLDGGWRAWTREARPSSLDAAPSHEPPMFVARPRPGLLVSKDEVFAALDQPEVCIVDALDRDTFRGTRQNYSRPGHIPGARNVPFMEIVDRNTHRYLPSDQLHDAFADVLSTHAERVITYCGGGIASRQTPSASVCSESRAWPSTTGR
jgi:thiosulfate/3-mercaptopyruvate sulfurtransferase